jgi:hypothetical protein
MGAMHPSLMRIWGLARMYKEFSNYQDWHDDNWAMAREVDVRIFWNCSNWPHEEIYELRMEKLLAQPAHGVLPVTGLLSEHDWDEAIDAVLSVVEIRRETLTVLLDESRWMLPWRKCLITIQREKNFCTSSLIVTK